MGRHFRATNSAEHTRANQGQAVPDYCANCGREYHAHTNGRCPAETPEPVTNGAKAYQDLAHLRSRGYTPRWWVSELPGDGGADWGWTDKPERAMVLTPYWQRRFMGYGRACGWRSYGLVPEPVPAPDAGKGPDSARAAEITEWLKMQTDAARFGSPEPDKVADVLVYGKVRDGGE